MTKTVFLDRDGVINLRIIDGYVQHPSELEILEGVANAVGALNSAGFRTVVVTNQRGIHLGMMNQGDLARIHAVITATVAAAGGCLTEFYFCPHGRDDACQCRKPAPGLLDQAHAFSPVDWSASYLVGDSDSDILAGRARGLTTIKVAGAGMTPADYVCDDFPDAVGVILDLDGKSSRV